MQNVTPMNERLEWRVNNIARNKTEDTCIYSFAVITINSFIACNETLFTSAKHEWKFEKVYYT